MRGDEGSLLCTMDAVREEDRARVAKMLFDISCIPMNEQSGNGGKEQYERRMALLREAADLGHLGAAGQLCVFDAKYCVAEQQDWVHKVDCMPLDRPFAHSLDALPFHPADVGLDEDNYMYADIVDGAAAADDAALNGLTADDAQLVGLVMLHDAAAHQNCSWSQAWLGILLASATPTLRQRGVENSSVAWLVLAANHGDPSAMHYVGTFHLTGDKGIRVDEKKGFDLIAQAAAMDFPAAHASLFGCLSSGIGTSVDHDRAYKSLLTAASLDVPGACHNIGQMHFASGDVVTAMKHWRLAIEARSPTTCYWIGSSALDPESRLYSRLEGEFPPEKAIELLTIAAEDAESDPETTLEARLDLGRVFEHGIAGHVEPDQVKAARWFSDAADLSGDASDLVRVMRKGLGSKTSEQERIAHFAKFFDTPLMTVAMGGLLGGNTDEAMAALRQCVAKEREELAKLAELLHTGASQPTDRALAADCLLEPNPVDLTALRALPKITLLRALRRKVHGVTSFPLKDMVKAGTLKEEKKRLKKTVDNRRKKEKRRAKEAAEAAEAAMAAAEAAAAVEAPDAAVPIGIEYID